MIDGVFTQPVRPRSIPGCFASNASLVAAAGAQNQANRPSGRPAHSRSVYRERAVRFARQPKPRVEWPHIL
jgi:hypothetical protein